MIARRSVPPDVRKCAAHSTAVSASCIKSCATRSFCEGPKNLPTASQIVLICRLPRRRTAGKLLAYLVDLRHPSIESLHDLALAGWLWVTAKLASMKMPTSVRGHDDGGISLSDRA